MNENSSNVQDEFYKEIDRKYMNVVIRS